MRFAFERDFDLERAMEAKRAARAALATFTEAELRQAEAEARAEGYADGRIAGRAEASSAADLADVRAQMEAVNQIVPRLDVLLKEADKHRADLESQVLDFTLSVFEKVAPDAMQTLSLPRVRTEVKQAIGMALGAAGLRIVLPKGSLDLIGEDLSKAVHEIGYAGRVEFSYDPALGAGDARVEWDNGFMDFSFNAVCDRIHDALKAAADAALARTSSERSDAHG
ncbi:FliH/SctL family protein [Maritimibacter alkaliphilus]|uniref:FliH/SctL family protein n=1 Tax=Maritimibacter alkaliphilus TaxID=404236 RepID=UPI001C93F3F2|nr:FliH/SctL family protein [Maritimibacter alkaliphilus]MBY6093028.1 hypothetical protein [Maritimibacter alkaliphilus]